MPKIAVSSVGMSSARNLSIRQKLPGAAATALASPKAASERGWFSNRLTPKAGSKPATPKSSHQPAAGPSGAALAPDAAPAADADMPEPGMSGPQSSAVTTIASHYRSHRARDDLAMQSATAAYIQSVWRFTRKTDDGTAEPSVWEPFLRCVNAQWGTVNAAAPAIQHPPA
jgi:hypothetical protein